ncbi:ATP-dependent zinc metalloprotease FtsH [Glycomyces endophyticus]|uniref:ATP-dependent zinc metalloprotease FtsH n=1 Tax=Glycomyces endophyticus TaxID=480996 RepID=UPI003CD05FEC
MVLIALIAVLIGSFWSGGSDYDEATTSEVLKDINDGNVEEAILLDKEQLVQLTLNSGDQVEAYLPAGMMETVATELEEAGVKFDTEVNETSVFVSFLLSLLPIVLIVLLLLFFMSQMQGGGSRVLNFGKSKAKMVSKDTPKTTFDDVAGADEAVEELREIKDFLEDPKKYQELGAKIPKGVLLFGPPGTGKTLLARAVAGEAGVPFYSISGSDFVEMFVGVGASRVRDLFTQAKENAPAIVFVDEIDAVGRHRGAGMGGGHDEREQTLNQLLVEMDGFDTRGGVILIAATNRPDILDPALLRPGRFDRQIPVDAPDKEGRQAILAVHAKGKPFVPNVEFDTIARRTPGFSGADLENVINEAALLTARHNQKAISADALEEAIDRVIAGPERKGRVMGDAEKKMTAYHEAGHALVAHALPHAAPVHKLTILPRGRSLGHTLVLPTEDKYTQTRSEMIDTLAYALGGRAAEELVYHDPTTGASNDIEKATKVARAMVTEYGMSSKLGAIKYGSGGSEPFLGREYGHQKDYSDEVAADIDGEVRALIEIAHDEAYAIVTEYRDVLDQMVTELLEKETLNQEDLERIATRVVKRPPMSPFNGTDKRKLGPPPVSTPNGSRPAEGPEEGIEIGPATEGQSPQP